MVSGWKLAPFVPLSPQVILERYFSLWSGPMIAVGRVRFVLSLGLCSVLGFACATWGQPGVISFRLKDNLIRVPVTLNGHSVEAVLDSGTGSLGLDLAFARSLGLEPAKTTGMVPGGGAPVPMYPVVLNEIQFGPERVTQVRGIALDLGHLSSSAKFPVQVLLGQPLFADWTLRVDYPARLITFLPRGQTASCSDPIPLVPVGGVPVIAVKLQATPSSELRTLHPVVDVGTRHYAAMLGGPFLERRTERPCKKMGATKQLGTGTGGGIEGSEATLARLQVGNCVWTG
jgi:Aspartyl protease